MLYTSAMKKLPRKLKSGKKLVATAADGNIGLYCKGPVRKETSKYILMTRSGKKSKGLMGSGGYPTAPRDLKWDWTDRKKKRKKSREEKMARNAKQIDPRPGHATQAPPSPYTSIAGLCVECGRDTFEQDHAHTLAHPEKGHAQVFCCKCRRMLGYKCADRKRSKKGKKRHGKKVDA